MSEDNICDKFSHDGFEKPCLVIGQICDDCQYLEECEDCDKIEAFKILLDEEHTKNKKLKEVINEMSGIINPTEFEQTLEIKRLKETINKMCGLKIQVPKEEFMDKIHSMGRSDRSHIMFVTPRISELKNCNSLFSMAAYCYSDLNKTKTVDEKIDILLKEVDLSIKSKIYEWKNKATVYDHNKEFRNDINDLFINYGYIGWNNGEAVQDLIVKIDMWKEKSQRYDELISKLEDECDNAYYDEK